MAGLRFGEVRELEIAGWRGEKVHAWAVYPPDFEMLNVASTAGASILAVGYFLPLVYLLYSLRSGQLAGPNPWDATGLEWQTSSPPPPLNFSEPPVVTGPPYDYVGRIRR